MGIHYHAFSYRLTTSKTHSVSEPLGLSLQEKEVAISLEFLYPRFLHFTLVGLEVTCRTLLAIIHELLCKARKIIDDPIDNRQICL